jgi:hypothetical protein
MSGVCLYLGLSVVNWACSRKLFSGPNFEQQGLIQFGKNFCLQLSPLSPATIYIYSRVFRSPTMSRTINLEVHICKRS